MYTLNSFFKYFAFEIFHLFFTKCKLDMSDVKYMSTFNSFFKYFAFEMFHLLNVIVEMYVFCRVRFYKSHVKYMSV